MRSALFASILLASTGCALPAETVAEARGAGTESSVPVRGATGACDAARAQGLVGRVATAELRAEAMRLSGAQSLRNIPEGTMVTMDFREDRLNIELDRANRVTRIRCG